MEGTSFIRFKTAFAAALNAELVAKGQTVVFAYDSPETTQDVMGVIGEGTAAWFDKTAAASYTVNVMFGEPIWVDENVQPLLVIQSLGLSTDDEQAVVDARANTVLGYAIAVLEHDPHLGIVDDTIETFEATPLGYTYVGHNLAGSDLSAARFDLRIDLRARLKLTT